MGEIVLLGCGGGRHQTIDQTFRTGGFRIHDQMNFHVDPGPGTLLLTNQLQLDPLDIDGVFISHSHPDHYADAEVLVEAIERNKSGKGRLLGSRSVIEGFEELGPVVSKYHQNKVGEVVSMGQGESFEFEGLKFESTPTRHSDPTGIGLKIHTSSGIIGYTGDTQYFEELPEVFKKSRVLIANVTRPDSKRIKGHLCTEDLIKILKEVNPDVAVIVHMGMLFLRNSPKGDAARVERRTGTTTVPGFVGTRIELDEGGVRVERPSEQAKISKFS